MTAPGATLEQHLADERRRHGGPDDEVAALLGAVATAGKALARGIRRAALEGNLGLAGGRNVTGDAQKKLDVLGNDTVVRVFVGTGLIAAVISEELVEALPLAGPAGHYVLCVDPLDGSSNTDINGPVGTIFGVYRRPKPGPIEAAADLLRAGSEQILAGYVMYGPATILVYTAGHGTHGLTLDLERDEFLLTHADIRCPARGSYYSANVARAPEWQPGIQRFLGALVTPGSAATAGGRTWSLRYTGALVADVHRSLIEGGIYFYPADAKNTGGKLRLLYECAPLAFVVEQAGGAASTGSRRILDIRAEAIHQRVPFVVGSAEGVALYERYAREDARP